MARVYSRRAPAEQARGHAPASRATWSRASRSSQGGDPAAAFDCMCPGSDVAGMATWQRGSLRLHLSSAWGPLPPRDQIVDLIEVHPPAKPGQCALRLRPRLGPAGGPELGGHQRPLAPSLERRAQHPLRPAVHGRGVEEAGAGGDGGVQDAPGAGLGGVAPDIEGLPGAHADDRHIESSRAQRTCFHAHPAIPAGRPVSGGHEHDRGGDGAENGEQCCPQWPQYSAGTASQFAQTRAPVSTPTPGPAGERTSAAMVPPQMEATATATAMLRPREARIR